MKYVCFLLLPALLFTACAHSQNNTTSQPVLAGGPCEGCEAVFEYGDHPLLPIDTLPDFREAGKKIRISGTIFQPDGKMPAKDVILYIYHTNQEGLYANRFNKKNWERRHGYLRGWVKTGDDGRYTFYTQLPGVYPDRTASAHIHPVILEPNGKYYWVEEYHFAGDSLLTEKEKAPVAPRGGTSGLLHLRQEADLWVAKRDFVLGKNIPGY